MGSEVKWSESRSVVSDSLLPVDYTVHGILQARILEWAAFPFSRGSSQPRDRTQVSHIAGGFVTSWATGKPKNTGVGSLSLPQGIFPTQGSNPGLPHCRCICYQLSHREAQEYWSGQPFPSPGDLPNPGIKPRSPTLQVDLLPAEPQGSPRILEWVAYPFPSGSSRPRNQTGVSCTVGRFLTNWAIRV